MGMKAIDELRGYAALLELNTTPGLSVVGRRLSEIAEALDVPSVPPVDTRHRDEIIRNIFAKRAEWWGRDPFMSARAVELGKAMDPNRFEHLEAFVAEIIRLVENEPLFADRNKKAEPVNAAPTREALLIKDMSDWWHNHSATMTNAAIAELRKFARRANDIYMSS
jgi:hypothetical protein